MNRLSKVVMLLLIASTTLAFTSVSNSKNKKSDSFNLVEKTRYFQCKVDGKLLQANDVGLQIIYVQKKLEANVWGKTSDGMISIILDSVSKPGTYTVKGNSKNGAGIVFGTDMFEVKKTGTPFTVTIDAIEDFKVGTNKEAKAIRGSFSGKLQNKAGKIIEITEGKFSAQ